jgi:4-amino-4-deoxy-L-arabinose transferase-like glycosyltransferase
MHTQSCSVPASCSSLTSCKVSAPADQEKGWPSWRWLVLLLILTTGMRLWQLTHTEVISRDTLHYIRMAWQLDQGPWKTVLPLSEYHPGYPVSILLVSHVVRPMVGDLVLAMQLSAQLASALASILLVIPMYYLGRELFDRRISFWGALLFQCLPASGRVLGDGLSEGLFLLWSASSLLYASRGLRSGCPYCFVLCGLFGGLAFLTRPEGAAVVLAAGLVLVLMQCWRAWRCTWERLLVRGACLVVPAVLVALPFNLTIGRLTAKPSAGGLLSSSEPSRPIPDQAPTLTAQPLATWWTGENVGTTGRLGWGLGVLLKILGRTFFWGLWIATLIGLWHHRRRLAGFPLTWVMGMVILILLALLYRITIRLGYLSERHMLLVLLCLIYPTAAGIDQMGRLLAASLARLQPALAKTAPAAWSLGLLLLLTAIPAFKSLEAIHHNRSGFKDVGYWLAENTTPTDSIYDPFGWAYFYSGRIFTEPRFGPGWRLPEPRYIVVEEGTGNNHPHLDGWARAQKLIKQGQGHPVHCHELQKGKIVVYEVSVH